MKHTLLLFLIIATSPDAAHEPYPVLWTTDAVASYHVAYPPRPGTEDYYTERIAVEWRKKGIDVDTQHRTPDGSWVDMLTPTHAWETEWAEKWKESVGQSLFYAAATNRKPAILLLLRGNGEREMIYYLRCLVVCTKWGIHLTTYRVESRPMPLSGERGSTRTPDSETR